MGIQTRQLGHDVVLPLPYGHHAAAAASQLFTMPAVPPRDMGSDTCERYQRLAVSGWEHNRGRSKLREMKSDPVALGFLHITRLEADLGAVDFAIDLVIAVDEANILGLGAALERAGAAAQFEIFDEDDGIAVG